MEAEPRRPTRTGAVRSFLFVKDDLPRWEGHVELPPTLHTNLHNPQALLLRPLDRRPLRPAEPTHGIFRRTDVVEHVREGTEVVDDPRR